MALKLRTKGLRKIKNPSPPLPQRFNNSKIVLEFSKKNWSDSWHRVGFVRAVTRSGGRWVQLGQTKPLVFGKQKITMDIDPVEVFQIQIVLVPWLPWVYVQLWEVRDD
jgi:hypothetical protein